MTAADGPSPGADSRPSVSVVIPCLNVAQTIGAQLEALARQDYAESWELLIADNGCTDATLTVVASFTDRLPIRVVDARTRRGINHARNRGTQDARSTFVLFCDGDDVVGPSWIRHMASALRTAEVVGGSIAERRPGEKDAATSALPRTLTKYDWLPSPIGANCGVQKVWWEKVGGFDESLDRGACDETDFFWRVQLAGGRVEAVPEASVEYVLPAGGKALARKRYRTGRERARLHGRYRRLGHPSRKLRHAAAHWLLVIKLLITSLYSGGARQRLGPSAAKAAGRLVGSCRYRTLYL